MQRAFWTIRVAWLWAIQRELGPNSMTSITRRGNVKQAFKPCLLGGPLCCQSQFPIIHQVLKYLMWMTLSEQ